MAARTSLFLLIFLLGTAGSREFPPQLIIWNVGQGQWVTIVDETACWHLDMGGEFAPWRQIVDECRRRANRISLSHWDMDHIDFVRGARGRLPDLCLLNSPLGQSSKRKMDLLENIPVCSQPSPFSQWSDPGGKTPNARSWVVLWRAVLAPGDSPRAQEKKWIARLPNLASTRFFVLGHHGSRTSTSQALLSALPQVQMAIASARRQRYGHPHPEVERDLSSRHIPLLRTEEWGTIHIQLN